MVMRKRGSINHGWPHARGISVEGCYGENLQTLLMGEEKMHKYLQVDEINANPPPMMMIYVMVSLSSQLWKNSS